jgi:hypothetical protein
MARFKVILEIDTITKQVEISVEANSVADALQQIVMTWALTQEPMTVIYSQERPA